MSDANTLPYLVEDGDCEILNRLGPNPHGQGQLVDIILRKRVLYEGKVYGTGPSQGGGGTGPG